MEPIEATFRRCKSRYSADTYLGMTLQWSTRLLVDIDDPPIWITREIDSNLDADFGHFLVNFRLDSWSAVEQMKS